MTKVYMDYVGLGWQREFIVQGFPRALWRNLRVMGLRNYLGGSLSIVHRLLQGLMGTCGGFEFRLFFWALVRTLRRVW